MRYPGDCLKSPLSTAISKLRLQGFRNFLSLALEISSPFARSCAISLQKGLLRQSLGVCIIIPAIIISSLFVLAEETQNAEETHETEQPAFISVSAMFLVLGVVAIGYRYLAKKNKR